jgi:hypothetical protein
MKIKHSYYRAPPLEAASTSNVPTIGPVQEKETIANAKAINNIPIIPLSFLDCPLYWPKN